MRTLCNSVQGALHGNIRSSSSKERKAEPLDLIRLSWVIINRFIQTRDCDTGEIIFIFLLVIIFIRFLEFPTDWETVARDHLTGSFLRSSLFPDLFDRLGKQSIQFGLFPDDLLGSPNTALVLIQMQALLPKPIDDSDQATTGRRKRIEAKIQIVYKAKRFYTMDLAVGINVRQIKVPKEVRGKDALNDAE